MTQASVLIVDDEPSVRQTLSEWMRNQNFHVLEAEGGRQAMEMIRRRDPDLVISDVVMPGMDGIQLLRQTRAVKMEVPFLMISGYPSHATAVDIMKLGASDYLPKPFSLEELTRRVDHILKSKSLARPLAPIEGAILAAVVSTTLWILILWAVSALVL